MKIEGLVGRTLRARPSGVSAALGLAARAGFLRPSAGGWLVLPLGMRVMDRMSSGLLEGIECQPVNVLNGRESDLRRDIAELLEGEIQSYRHLPLRIATSWQRSVAESTAEGKADAWSWLAIAGAFADGESLDAFLGRARANVQALARSAGFEIEPVRAAEDLSALIACGSDGQSSVLKCGACGSSYLRQVAPFAREQLKQGTPGALERLHTPGASTIQALADMLSVDRSRTLKALFLSTETGDLIFAVLRGDLDASIEKLARAAGARTLRPATDSEILAAGAFPGFASPIGMRVRKAGERDGIHVVADPSIYTGSDFAAGANAADYHFVHVDPRRDFLVTQVADVAVAPPSACCTACGGELTEQAGTLVAHCFPLKSPAFADETGVEKRASAGWMQIDLLALFEQVVGACADEDGIAWPVRLAPADIHVISLRENDACLGAVDAFERKGLQVLFDDRPIGAGAKFADADLIGCPLRVTVSSRSLQAGGAEVAGRRGATPEVVPLEQLASLVEARLRVLMST